MCQLDHTLTRHVHICEPSLATPSSKVIVIKSDSYSPIVNSINCTHRENPHWLTKLQDAPEITLNLTFPSVETNTT
jgi:hypothetical protein